MKYTIIDGELYRTDELYHHGIKGMRWGVRRKLNKMSNADIKKEMARKKLENDYAQVLSANKQAERQRKQQERQERAKYRAESRNLRDKNRLERFKNRTALIDAKKKQAESKKLLREANIKLSREDQRKVDEMNRQKQVTDAKTAKLNADLALKEAKKANWSGARKVVNKILSKFGNAALDGAAEAGKNLLKDKLIAFGKDKLGLNKKDELSILKEEADLLETKNRIKKAKGEKDELTRTREEAELLETQARLKRAKGEDPGENARLKAQRLENEEKIATKTKAAEERERENKQRAAEEASLQRRLEELSNRSSEQINRSANDDINRTYDAFTKSGVESVQIALKKLESRQKQEEYRRKREELLRKKK